MTYGVNVARHVGARYLDAQERYEAIIGPVMGPDRSRP